MSTPTAAPADTAAPAVAAPATPTPGSAAPSVLAGGAVSTIAPGSDGSWKTTLPQELQSAPSLAKFNEPAALAKSYLELEGRLGNSVQLPQAHWGEKEYGMFWDKLGRPTTPEGYEFTAPKELPAGTIYAPEQDKWFSATAHKLGIDKARATALRENFMTFQAEQAQANSKKQVESQAKQQKALDELRMQYGPKWDQSIDAANKVLSEYGGPAMVDLLKEHGLQGHPAAVSMFIKIAGVLMDHSVISGNPWMQGNFGNSPSTAAAEIEKLKMDKDFTESLIKANHPKHDENYKRWRELHAVAYPPKTTA